MRSLVLCLVLAACGLGPEPAPATSSGGGGNAPWADLGPTTVCHGDQAIDGPTATPGGSCLSPLTPGTMACTRDADCNSREACVCGRCAVAYCASAADCDPTRTCSFAQHRCDRACSPSVVCADGEECIASVCRGRCGTSAECQHGEVCDRNHVCITDDCVDATGCLAGETCELQRTPRQLLEPAPIVRAGEIVLYVDVALPATPDVRAIWRAVGTDGRHFAIDPLAPVIADARAPSVVVDGDLTYLYFEQSGALRVASSTDGVTFSPPTTVLAGGVGAPSVVIIAGEIVAYYVRGSSIALATGLPGGPLVDRGVVLSPTDVQVGDPSDVTSAFWNPVTKLASPHAVLAGPEGPTAPGATIHLWFAGFGQESPPASKFGQPDPIPPNFSIGFAAAEPDDPGSLAVWPYGPVADHVEVFLEHHDELGPAVIDTGDDSWLLYYIDATRTSPAGEDGPFTVGRLTVLGSGVAVR